MTVKLLLISTKSHSAKGQLKQKYGRIPLKKKKRENKASFLTFQEFYKAANTDRFFKN